MSAVYLLVSQLWLVTGAMQTTCAQENFQQPQNFQQPSPNSGPGITSPKRSGPVQSPGNNPYPNNQQSGDNPPAKPPSVAEQFKSSASKPDAIFTPHNALPMPPGDKPASSGSNPLEVLPVASTNIVAPDQPPTIEELTIRNQAVAKDMELDEATRTAITQHYAKAIENLQGVEKNEALRIKLEQELDTAPQTVTDLEKHLANPLKTELPTDADVKRMTLEELNAKLKDAETPYNTAKQSFQNTQAIIEQRKARRPQLEDLRIQTEAQLQEVTQQLTLPPPDGENPKVTPVRILRLQSRQHKLRSDLKLITQEAKTYEGTLKLWSLQRDVQELDTREGERKVQFWQQQISEGRRLQAEKEAREARIALVNSNDSIKIEAEKNAALAEENSVLTKGLQDSQFQLTNLQNQLAELDTDSTSLKKRAEKAEFSPVVGVLLRNRRATLPNLSQMRIDIEKRQNESSALSLKMMEWDLQRKSLFDLKEATKRNIDSMEFIPDSIQISDLDEQVLALLTTRKKLLSDLIENGQLQLDKLVSLDSQEKDLIRKVEAEAQWLAEQVFWVRSTRLAGTNPRLMVSSVRLLFDPQRWHDVGRNITYELKNKAIWWGTAVFIALIIIFIRQRIKHRIRALGIVAGRPRCLTFLPTLEALFWTVVVSVTIPAILWGIGIRLRMISMGEPTMQSIGFAIQISSAVWAICEFLRLIAQHDGLGASHFAWPERAMVSLRRTMRMLNLTIVPLIFVLVFAETFGDELKNEEVIATIGRAAYLALISCMGMAIYNLIRPSSPLIQALDSPRMDNYLWNTRWVWISCLYVIPVALIVLSVLGFHYTAVQLALRLARTLLCGLAILLISSVLSRWLLVTYRNLAIRRAQERREQLQKAAKADPEFQIPPDAIPEIRLLDVNVQSRRLLTWVTSVTFVVLTFMIWVDVMPALGFLNKIDLWPNELVVSTPEKGVVSVTAADLLFAAFICMLTFVSSRNIPGLMEILVWQRLPMDAGARYAASTISRYVIIVTGLVLGFRYIGIGWSSVQWLVAAMSVGLGFGLQEIFANFVSGIILLFERPIRVGDTVTISNITGTVSRIQTRATTITDWDNKELIVPNREFVTGHLVNWTLSNNTIRLVIPVGVAYGSDPVKVIKLMTNLANENPLVMKEPEPFVSFSKFGNSSLDFELRVFVNGMANFRKLKNELHMKIHEVFRINNIEIPFPQQDLYIRSIPPELANQITAEEAMADQSR
jgi:potassium efflux system protein